VWGQVLSGSEDQSWQKTIIVAGPEPLGRTASVEYRGADIPAKW
jgi:hypothetical protein